MVHHPGVAAPYGDYSDSVTEDQSDAVTCTTTPYGVPASLQVQLQSAVPELLLTWNTAPGASGGYNVYRGTYAGGEDDTPVLH